MSRYRSPSRPPVKYDSGEFGKIIRKVYDDLNRVATKLDSTEQELVKLKGIVREERPPEVRAEWLQVTDTNEYAELRLWIESGKGQVDKIQVRSTADQYAADPNDTRRNIDPGLAWTQMTYPTDWITDSAYGIEGGYYRHRIQLSALPAGEELLTVQAQCVNFQDRVVFNQLHTFDRDRMADVRNVTLKIGAWDESSGKFPVLIDIEADEDTGSIGYAFATSALANDATITDETFTAQDVQRIEKLELAKYVPSTSYASSTIVYVAVAAWTGAAKAGTRSSKIIREQIVIPSKLTSGALDDGTKVFDLAAHREFGIADGTALIKFLATRAFTISDLRAIAGTVPSVKTRITLGNGTHASWIDVGTDGLEDSQSVDATAVAAGTLFVVDVTTANGMGDIAVSMNARYV